MLQQVDWTVEQIWWQIKSVGQGSRGNKTGLDRTGGYSRSRCPNIWRSKVAKAHQCLSREHLQQGDKVVSISEVLVQVCDVSLGLRTKEKRQIFKFFSDIILIDTFSFPSRQQQWWTTAFALTHNNTKSGGTADHLNTQHRHIWLNPIMAPTNKQSNLKGRTYTQQQQQLSTFCSGN